MRAAHLLQVEHPQLLGDALCLGRGERRLLRKGDGCEGNGNGRGGGGRHERRR